MRRSAVVIGATGATGKSLVEQLLRSSQWDRVTVIHRRELDTSGMDLTQEQRTKLTQHQIDMGQILNHENVQLFAGHDATFCTLGTTRDRAGTAQNFRKVDVTMVRESAIVSKQANVKHFSLLTSKGANAGLWYSDWKLFHGLLYLQSKGQIENEVIAMQFPRTSIFRPGLLERGGTARWKLVQKLMDATNVKDVAKAMMVDAESTEIDINNQIESPVFYEANAIKNMAKVT